MAKLHSFIVLKPSGFTLLETLVAVGLLAMLTTIGFTSYTNTMKNSRDARRRTDLQTIRQALEMYKSDTGNYPTGSGSTESNLKSSLSSPTAYISSDNFPKDPRATTDGYFYYYSSATGTNYNLCVLLENGITSGDSACGATTKCNATDNCNYGVTQP